MCVLPAKLRSFVPVGFVVGIIVTLYSIYVFVHCPLMLQLHLEPYLRDRGRERRGYLELVIVHVLTIPLVACYARSIAVHPGTIPDAEEWRYDPNSEDAERGKVDIKAPVQFKEKKRTGERRHCKKCHKYKPDRCHHCRACDICILKMDHHCPWIYNCVGFNNHKYFFLLLLYSTLDLHFIAWTTTESIRGSVEEETPFYVMFLLLFGSTCASFLGILVSCFFSFHIWLGMKAMTTIEFCEKSLKKQNYDTSQYNEGIWANAKAVLGPNPFLMLLPLSPPVGDGLSYNSEHSYLARTPETTRGPKKRRPDNARPRPVDANGSDSGNATPSFGDVPP